MIVGTKRKLGLLFALLIAQAVYGDAPECSSVNLPKYKPKDAAEALTLFRLCGKEWSRAQKKHLLDNFLTNPDGSYSGAIIASPSAGRERQYWPGHPEFDPGEPDYRFHWIRDSAIAVQALAGAYKLQDSPPAEQKKSLEAMIAYVHFSDAIQKMPISHDYLYFDERGQPQFYVWRDGQKFNVTKDHPGAIPVRYGEPKVRVALKTVKGADGKPTQVLAPADFQEEWGRPQNDGPALRVVATAKILSVLEAERKGYTVIGSEVPKQLDDAIATALKVMKEDLAFVQARWKDPSFDIWEEVLADHFYTRSAMSEAIEKGIPAMKSAAKTAGIKLTGVDFDGLQKVHDDVEKSLREFFTGDYIQAFRNEKFPSGRATGKDMAVILAAVRRRPDPKKKDPLGNFSASDPRVLATAMDLIREFQSDPKYIDPPGVSKPGLPLGRYPKDRWNGRERVYHSVLDRNNQEVTPGNPWPITTLAMDELFLKAALEFHEAGGVEINALNRSFFEYVYGGADQLPKEWKKQLDAGKKVQIDFKSQPFHTNELLSRILLRGTEFAARLLHNGLSPYEAAPEQTLGENSLGDLMKAIEKIGARGLTWNAAQYLRTRKCFLRFRDLRNTLQVIAN